MLDLFLQEVAALLLLLSVFKREAFVPSLIASVWLIVNTWLLGIVDTYSAKALNQSMKEQRDQYFTSRSIFWLAEINYNLGILDEKEMDILSPYVKGICASIETVEERLHDKLCPDKPIKPYSEMLKFS